MRLAEKSRIGEHNGRAGHGFSSFAQTLLEVIDGNEQHEWRAEHEELISGAKRQLWYRVLSLCIFVHDFDPYAIFKHDHEDGAAAAAAAAVPAWSCASTVSSPLGTDNRGHPSELATRAHNASSVFRTRELQMRRTSRDDFRCKSTRFIKILSLYCTTKSTLVAAALFFSLKHEQSIGPSTLKDHELQGQPAGAPPAPPLWCATILRVLGNPFGAFEDIAVVLVPGMAGFCTLCFVILPLYYYKRWPMDSANLRFILEPRHELARIDASIQLRLASFKSSLRVYRSRQIERVRTALPSGSTKFPNVMPSVNGPGLTPSEILARELSYCEKIEFYLDEFCTEPHELKSFRPKTFTPAYYVTITRAARLAVLGSHIAYTFSLVVLSSGLSLSAYSNRCPELNCDPFRAFTPAELLAMLEPILVLCLNTLGSALNIALLFLLSKSQLDLIASTKTELLACKRAIQMCTDFSHEGHFKTTTISGQEAAARGDGRALRDPRDRLERQMLKSLIRLSVWNKELEDNTKCISEQIFLPFYNACGGLLLALFNSQFKDSNSNNYFRAFVVFIICASFNLYAVACANIYARVLEIERSSWSILAEGSQFFGDNHHKVQALARSPGTRKVDLKVPLIRDKSCAFVADLWVKFVRSTSSNIGQHCSRIFNIELSYQTIIEANFFTILIYSLTLSHQGR